MPLPPKGELHTDYVFFLRWIPRGWTSFLGLPPVKWFGNAVLKTITLENRNGSWERVEPGTEIHFEHVSYEYPPPIPDPGQWWVGRGIWGIPTFAWHSQIHQVWKWRVSLYARGITRFDDLANYWTAPSPTVKPYLHPAIPAPSIPA